MSWSRSPVFIASVALAGLWPGCTCDESNDAPAAATTMALSPVPTPEGLVAAGRIDRPEELWQKLRIALGGSAFLVPKSLGGALATLLDLPLGLAPEVDGDVPAGLALGAGEERLALAIAIHVKAGDRVLQLLTHGDLARFDRGDAKEGALTSLVSRDADRAMAYGIVGNYLVVANDEAALAHYGPYAARTAPTRDDLGFAPAADAVASLEAGASWPAELSGGLAQSIADVVPGSHAGDVLSRVLPTPPVGLGERFGGAQARLEIDETGLLLALEPAGEPLAAAPVPEELTGLPAGLFAAVYQRQSKSERDASASVLAAGLRAAGTLGEDEVAAIKGALLALSAAREDAYAFGLGRSATGPYAVARIPHRDPGEMRDAIDGFFMLAEEPGIARSLLDLGVTVEHGESAVELVPGEIGRARFRVGSAQAGPTDAPSTAAREPDEERGDVPAEGPQTVDAYYRLGERRVDIATGLDATGALRELVRDDASPRLGADDAFMAAMTRMPAGLQGLVVADLGAVRAMATRSPAPSVRAASAIGYGAGPAPGNAENSPGSGKDKAWLRVFASRDALTDLLGWFSVR